jgi:AraC-like DNA-binding protein
MAAAEIKKNDSLLKEIAEDFGYFDNSHFFRVFQQYFHCSPSEFREINAEQLQLIPDDQH